MIEHMTLKQAREKSIKWAKEMVEDFYYEIGLLTDGITTDFIFIIRTYVRNEIIRAETFRTYSNKYESKEIESYKKLLNERYQVIECKGE